MIMKVKFWHLLLPLLFLVALSNNVVKADTLVDKMWIDDPSTNQTFNQKDVLVRGWALSASGVKQISILLNDNLIGQATGGLDRPDVNKVYPGYPGGDKSGYSYNISYGLLRSGSNKITVKAVGNDGKEQQKSTYVISQKPESKLWIDDPGTNQTFNQKDVLVRGWALSASGISQISILLNDNLIGQATSGLDRPDVNKVYPGYPGGDKSGYSYNISYGLLRSGSNKITVKAVGNDGEEQQKSTYVISQKPEPMLCIDDPSNGIVIGEQDLVIMGWAVNASGVNKINIYSDGNLLGQATGSLYRPDVDAVYPGYPSGKNSGYTYTVKGNLITNGTHVIKVEAVGTDGSAKNSSVTVIKKTLDPLLFVDEPGNGSTFKSSSVYFRGWALNNTGIKAVNVYVDKVLNGTAAIGQSRPDVAKVFPQYPNGDTSGFSYTLDVNKIPPGIRSITVEAVGNDDSKLQYNMTVNIQKPEFKVYLDDPSTSQVFEEKDVNIRGWALNASGIKRIDVLLDGQKIGTANTGLPRPDVNRVYPGYPQGDNSGYSYTIANDDLKPGTYTVTVNVTGNDGSQKSVSAKIIKKYQLPQMNVESIGSGFVSNNSDITVKGWALSRKGISKVNIYVDDILNGQATLGISRPDVAAVYPQFINAATSGYQYTIGVDSIKPGLHRVKVESVGVDGIAQQCEYTIEIKKKAPLSHIDQPSTNFTIKTSSVTVGGWSISDSNLKDIRIQLDGQDAGTASLGLTRKDVDAVYPGYKNGAVSGFTYQLDTSKLGLGSHIISIIAEANDGTTSTDRVQVNMFGVVNYVNYPNSLSYYVDRQFANGGNANWDGSVVTKDDVAYYMNPDNFINSTNAKYMFLKLTYMDGITVDDLNKALVGKGILEGKGSAFLAAGKAVNVNPIYLVAHALLETGNGCSTLAKGINVSQIHQTFGDIGSPLVNVTPQKVYNVYGVGALDSNANLWGSEKAYAQKWFTVDDAIIGGASWIAQGYIASTTYKQYTLYRMKWNFDVIWHEYATDIGWAYKQTSKIGEIINMMDNPVLYFEVPTFTN
ncbi:MAG: Ig-like domain-containing protein [Bacillota bacterium]|nr:Ig-like domain-containing protein [Bacillota bacterium]